MTQEVKYNGQTAIPDDYSAPDGDLEVSLNLIHEDGALKPIPEANIKAHLVAQNAYTPKIVYIHTTTNYKHYIVNCATNSLSWFEDSDIPASLEYYVLPNVNPISISAPAPFPSEIKHITSLGNTLIVFCEDAMYYFIWKGTGYKYLGTHMPELPLSFGLQGHIFANREFHVSTDSKPPSSLYNSIAANAQRPLPQVLFSESTSQLVREFVDETTAKVLAEVNSFVAGEVTKKGRFIYPFLVRYAFRLYDGSLTMHSAPVLMVPSTKWAPRVFIDGMDEASAGSAQNTVIDDIVARLACLICDLDYACIDSNALTALTDWSDIVKSVDVFISAPFYTYNQSGKIEGWQYRSAETVDNYAIARIMDDGLYYDVDVPNHNKYARVNIHPLIVPHYNTGINGKQGKTEYILPHSDVEEQIRNCGTFYFLKEIKIEDLTTTRTKIDIPADYLQSLVNREVMTDEYHSHDSVTANVSHIYNDRLNIADVTRYFVNPFNLASSISFCNTIFDWDENNLDYSEVASDVGLYQFAKIDIEPRAGIIETLLGKSTSILHSQAPILYYYHPDTKALKAYSIAITTTPDAEEQTTLELSNHATLNGKLFFKGFYATPDKIGVTPHQSHAGTTDISNLNIRETNKIWLSEVSNPFLFLPTHIASVGSDLILGLCSNTQPISQGQFGQHPLYCFTTEGVWVLSVSNTGTYSAVQPITRDVCTNPASITPIDNAVLFATARGIMLIAGGQTTEITNIMDDEFPFDLSQLHKLQEAFADAMVAHIRAAKGDSEVYPWMLSYRFQPAPVPEFLRDCRIIYDYTHQHIIVFNPELKAVDNVYRQKYPYAYIYSLKSKKWGMQDSKLMYALNSYPEAYAMAYNQTTIFNTDIALSPEADSSTQSDDIIPIDDDMPPEEMPGSQTLGGADLCNMSEYGGFIPTGLMVTRPLKLGASDTLKEIKTLIQRGFFARGEVATVLYGSRDLISWHLIGSSTDNFLRHIHGTGYKYFRIAAITNLTAEHSLHGASMEAKARHTDKLR